MSPELPNKYVLAQKIYIESFKDGLSDDLSDAVLQRRAKKAIQAAIAFREVMWSDS